METATGNFGSGVPATAFPLLAPDGSAAAPSYSFASETGSGMFRRSAFVIDFSISGVPSFDIQTSRIIMRSGQQLQWSATDTSAGVPDTGAYRNAAGVLEINNGTAGVFRDLIARGVSSQTTGTSPAITITQSLLWLPGTFAPALTLVDSSRTANNRIADLQFQSGFVALRFVNDAYGAATGLLTVTGGYAAGITSVLFGGTSATVFGVNGAAGQAQKTGFGTPTGTGVIANFPGATATLAQTSQAVAQIIADLKALGFYGA